MSFFITTKNMSRQFPLSRLINDDEIGGRVILESGQIVREFTPTQTNTKKQYWVTKHTGDVYRRDILTNNTYTWTYLTDHSFNITQAVAQAWIEPPTSDVTLFARAIGEVDYNASSISWFPSLGSSTDIHISVTSNKLTNVNFIKVEDTIPKSLHDSTNTNEVENILQINLLPLYNGSSIVPKSTTYYSQNKQVLYVRDTQHNMQEYSGIRSNIKGVVKKFTLAEGTVFLSDIIKCLTGIPRNSQIDKNIKICNAVHTHGLNFSKIREAIHSRASDRSLCSYLVAASMTEDYIEDRIWKNVTTKAMRLAVTNMYDPNKPLKLKEIYDHIEENYDSAIVGKSDYEIYMEIRIIVDILNKLKNTGKDFDIQWF